MTNVLNTMFWKISALKANEKTEYIFPDGNRKISITLDPPPSKNVCFLQIQIKRNEEWDSLAGIECIRGYNLKENFKNAYEFLSKYGEG